MALYLITKGEYSDYYPVCLVDCPVKLTRAMLREAWEKKDDDWNLANRERHEAIAQEVVRQGLGVRRGYGSYEVPRVNQEEFNKILEAIPSPDITIVSYLPTGTVAVPYTEVNYD